MRIRKRHSSSSSSSYPTLTPPSLLQVPDPYAQVPPEAKGGGNGGGTRGGKTAEELHQEGDLQIDPHGLREDPPRTSPHHPNLPKPGQVQAMEEVMVKGEEGSEQERKMDWSKEWHPQANSNKSGSSSALVQSFTLTQKRVSYDINGDKDYEWSKKPKDKERKTKATAVIKAKGKAGAASVAGNSCTAGVNGGDNEWCNTGGATTVMEQQNKGSLPSGGPAAAAVNGNGATGKRRRSPAVLMEGSRCSRVNGRGWRCCQQTLVGYSLCEHHLGKGRLRSMSSVRGQIGATTRTKKNAEGGGAGGAEVAPSSAQEQQLSGADNGSKEVKQEQKGHEEEEEEEEVENDEEKETRRKWRKKIGVVKARSISSLLDAVEHVTSMAPSEVAPPPRFSAPAGAEAMT